MRAESVTLKELSTFSVVVVCMFQHFVSLYCYVINNLTAVRSLCAPAMFLM